MPQIKKMAFKIYRTIIGKNRIYGTFSIGNRFQKNVYMSEFAKIGKYNYFGENTSINNIIIGNYCSFGQNVKLGQGQHSLDYITTNQKISSDLIGFSLLSQPAIINNDVWCGANVVIMQGVKIGNGAVIGANAVVTHDIPEYAIAVGVPARVIKYRFNKEQITIIKKSNWFNENMEEAKNKVQMAANEINTLNNK